MEMTRRQQISFRKRLKSLPPITPTPSAPAGIPTCYSMVNAQGKIIYVGVTGRLLSQLRATMRDRLWAEEVVGVVIEEFTTMQEAVGLASTIYVEEHPRYNNKAFGF